MHDHSVDDYVIDHQIYMKHQKRQDLKYMRKMLSEIWAYREMIWGLVHRELRGRYKGSTLGFLWTFINPLLQLAVYSMVFSVILRSGIEKYYLHLFVALIPWIFFSSSVGGGCSCILNQTAMVTKIYFPREVLPIAYVTAAFVNMVLSFSVVIPVVLLSGVFPSAAAFLCLIPVMCIEYVLCLGFCMLLSAASVYVRDLVHIMEIVVMAWQFLTPVMYSINMVPERFVFVFKLNPMTGIIQAYRQILYYGTVPDGGALLISFAFSIAILYIGVFAFEKLKVRFAEQM